MYTYYSTTYRSSDQPGALEINQRARQKERECQGICREISLLGLLMAAFGLSSRR